MDYGVIIFVLAGALINVASAQTRQYYFESTPLNWTEAQSFCRQVYTDLATVETISDVSTILRTTSGYTGKAWIGLYDHSWRWSLSNNTFYGEEDTGFRNWAPERPINPNGQQNCVLLLNNYYYYYYYNYNNFIGTWLDISCNNYYYSVCYNGSVNGISSFVRVNKYFNWFEAQRYCRENYVDLASIRNLAENDIIADLAAGQNVWIGLYWEQLWSDGSTSLFQNWASGQPDSTEQCVTTVFRNSGLWSDDSCSLTFPFICYSTTPPKTEDFRSIGQNETSITLQWNKVNNNFSFILQFNDAEINITAPDGDGPVTYTVSSLTAATEYTFTLYSVFENVRSSGVSITAVTAPPNAENFRLAAQEVTSMTLQWNKVNNSGSFILQFNGAEINITAPDGDGPVTYTVSSLTPETSYSFTLFSVFENVRSSGVSITAATGNRKYYFESTRLNWTEAQRFCRRVYTDLATIETYNDVYSVLYYTSSGYTGKAWIGLYGEGWRWSLSDSSFYGEGEAKFRNWSPGYPYNSYGQDNCVMLQSFYYYYYYFYDYTGRWMHVDCNYRFFSVCYNGSVNGKSSFVKVNTPLKWTEAQRYCRENYVDLASVRNRAENFAIAKLAAGESVWIGLHREQLWSDGSPSVFKNWASGQPDSTGQCVTTSFRNSGQWSDDNCSLTLPFVCYSTTPPKTEDFRAIRQAESYITLQWNKVNNSVSFILQFNGAEININQPYGDGPVTYTVYSLTARTTYRFTLFSVFENVRSSGINITAFTAPPNAENFISTAQDVTSITLEWNKVSNVSYILQFNGVEIEITATDGDGPVTYTVSSLTPGTTYWFNLFSVFENARSSGIYIIAVTGTRHFYFEAMPLNWTEAQSFCRRVYTDLATIETQTDVYAILGTRSSYRGKAWIGLYDDNWRWSLSNNSFYGEGDTGFRNWAPGHPYLAIGQNCVLLQNFKYLYFYYYGYRGTWVDVNCNDLFYSVCYNGSVNGTSSFVKVDTPLNWAEAQRYCRENYIDLASIRNQAENDAITNLAAEDFVWIGLYREQLWSDGSTSMFQYWAYGQPDSPEQCVTTSFSYSGQWSDDSCSLTLPFICYSTTPPNAEDFRSIRQDETSITLQWNIVNNSISFILQFNGGEFNTYAPYRYYGPITYTVSSLTAATEYSFTLVSVFANGRSSGLNITAITAPPNAKKFRPIRQNETSITLKWNKVNNSISFILQFNDAQFYITAPDGDGPVTYTVSSLTARTTYRFTLFSVFENVLSSGVSIYAATGPNYVLAMNVELESLTQLSDSELQSLLEDKSPLTALFNQYGLVPPLSIKVLRREIRKDKTN